MCSANRESSGGVAWASSVWSWLLVRKSWNSDSSVLNSTPLHICTESRDFGIFVGDFGTVQKVSLIEI